MGLLAYDPERLAFLKLRLATALDELRALRCGDPAAQYAMRSVAIIRNEIEQVWLPLVKRVLDNTALTRVSWYSPNVDDDLRNALINVMADGYGWSVQRDPLDDDAAVVTAAEARALGAMLNSADLVALAADREQLRWLAQQLNVIGRSATLSAQFLANFDSWATVTYVLGKEHALNHRPDIDPVFDGLMDVWKHTLPPGALTAGKSATLASLLPPIEDVDPYVQAPMVRALHPDAMTVATVTNELLTRWLAMKHDPGARAAFDRIDGPGLNAGDLLMPSLLDDPAACVWFTELAAEHPAVLFETLNDPDAAYQVVLIGTNPATTSTTSAGHAVLAILDYFRVDPYSRPPFDTDGHPGEYGTFLGALVAPWLLQFSMMNDDWPASPAEKAAALRVALRDEAAMEQLIDDAERIRVGFSASLADDIGAAHEIGALLNLLLQLSVNERVDDELASSDGRLDLLWTVIGVSSSFLPGGPLVGIGTGFALTALTSKVDEYLDQPDPTGERRSAEQTMDVVLTFAGAEAVSRLHALWVADGSAVAPPPTVDVTSACPSADYHRTFDDWRAALPGGIDGALSQQANELLSAFVGASEAQSNCAELAG